jgi:Putative zinc-finger
MAKMKIMDHNEAVRLQAAEKYVLGELPKEQHAAYEEHYFDCPACAEEIKATVTFMESARQVAREEALQPVGARRNVPGTQTTDGWFAWLRPAFAVPVLAALVLFIGYQNGVTIPRLKDFSSSQIGQTISSSFQLRGSVRGGNESGDAANKVRVRAGESFSLNFDFTPTGTFSEYDWQLRDQGGRAVRFGHISGDKKYQAVSLNVAGGVESAGKYNLVFFGGADDNGQTANRNEAQRLTFTVEFLQ